MRRQHLLPLHVPSPILAPSTPLLIFGLSIQIHPHGLLIGRHRHQPPHPRRHDHKSNAVRIRHDGRMRSQMGTQPGVTL